MPLLMSLTLSQGHKIVRKQRLLQQLSCKVQNWFDEVWCAIETYWSDVPDAYVFLLDQSFWERA